MLGLLSRHKTHGTYQELETAKLPTRYSCQPQREAQEFEFVFSNATQQCLSLQSFSVKALLYTAECTYDSLYYRRHPANAF